MLNSKSLGLAGGILWGGWMFVFTFLNMYFGYGAMFGAFMADVYPGYQVSAVGSFIGLVYGFLDGFIGLYVLAWIYNKLNG